jgi:hypothetical protein
MAAVRATVERPVSDADAATAGAGRGRLCFSVSHGAASQVAADLAGAKPGAHGCSFLCTRTRLTISGRKKPPETRTETRKSTAHGARHSHT